MYQLSTYAIGKASNSVLVSREREHHQKRPSFPCTTVLSSLIPVCTCQFLERIRARFTWEKIRI